MHFLHCFNVSSLFYFIGNSVFSHTIHTPINYPPSIAPNSPHVPSLQIHPPLHVLFRKEQAPKSCQPGTAKKKKREKIKTSMSEVPLIKTEQGNQHE